MTCCGAKSAKENSKDKSLRVDWLIWKVIAAFDGVRIELRGISWHFRSEAFLPLATNRLLCMDSTNYEPNRYLMFAKEMRDG